MYLLFISSDSDWKKICHFFHVRYHLEQKIDSILSTGFAATEDCTVYFTVINEQSFKYCNLCRVGWSLNI